MTDKNINDNEKKFKAFDRRYLETFKVQSNSGEIFKKAFDSNNESIEIYPMKELVFK